MQAQLSVLVGDVDGNRELIDTVQAALASLRMGGAAASAAITFAQAALSAATSGPAGSKASTATYESLLANQAYDKALAGLLEASNRFDATLSEIEERLGIERSEEEKRRWDERNAEIAALQEKAENGTLTDEDRERLETLVPEARDDARKRDEAIQTSDKATDEHKATSTREREEFEASLRKLEEAIGQEQDVELRGSMERAKLQANNFAEDGKMSDALDLLKSELALNAEFQVEDTEMSEAPCATPASAKKLSCALPDLM